MDGIETVSSECRCIIGPEWSGSASADDAGWECDDCGRFIPCERAGTEDPL